MASSLGASSALSLEWKERTFLLSSPNVLHLELKILFFIPFIMDIPNIVWHSSHLFRLLCVKACGMCEKNTQKEESSPLLLPGQSENIHRKIPIIFIIMMLTSSVHLWTMPQTITMTFRKFHCVCDLWDLIFLTS